MRVTELIGSFRKRRIWGFTQRVYRTLGPLICAAIHRAVVALSDRIVPTNLALKHEYDYRLIYVNPTTIRRGLKVGVWRSSNEGQSARSRLRQWYRLGDGWKSVRTHVSRNLHGDFMAYGDWDKDALPFDLLPVVVQLFLERRPPQDTGEYQRYAARIRAGQLAWTKGLRSIEELDEYFAALIDTFDDIRAHGYRTQDEIGGSGVDEIRVCVDRHGRLCVFGGGTHRLSIAKLLRVERVPVILKRVHSTWVREWMQTSGTDDPVAAIRQGVAFLEAATPDNHEGNLGLPVSATERDQ